jgi:hypothetical protein
LTNDIPHLPDVEQLRAAYPAWDISVTWVPRVSGPDLRLLIACRNGLRLAGFSAAELARMIEAAERQYGWPRTQG